MTESFPGLGDNLPPKEFAIGESITTYLKGIHHRLTTRRDELVGAESRLPPLPTDQDAPEAERAVTEYLRQIAALVKASDTERETTKAPYLDGGRRVDAFFKAGIMDPLAALDTRVRKLLTAYKRGVESRERARLEAEAKAAEAAAVDDKTLNQAIEAAEMTKAPSTELTRARSAYGASSSLSYFLDVKSIDRKALLESAVTIAALADFFTDEILDKVVRAYMRAKADHIKAALEQDPEAGKRLKGIVFFMNSRTNIR